MNQPSAVFFLQIPWSTSASRLQESISLHSSDFHIVFPSIRISKFGEIGIEEPAQNILHNVFLLLVHEPVTRTLVIDNLRLGEELLDQTNGDFGARTVSSSTEEDNGDLDCISHWKIAGWNFEESKTTL